MLGGAATCNGKTKVEVEEDDEGVERQGGKVSYLISGALVEPKSRLTGTLTSANEGQTGLCEKKG